MDSTYFNLSRKLNHEVMKHLHATQKALATSMGELIFTTQGKIIEPSFDIIRYYLPEKKVAFAFPVLYFRLNPQINKKEIIDVLRTIKEKIPNITLIDFLELRNTFIFVLNIIILVNEKETTTLTIPEVPDFIRPYLEITESGKKALKELNLRFI